MNARPTDRTRFRRDAEANFPIKIDIAVACGQPWPYADMLAWCRENMAPGVWDQHGFMDRKRRDEHGFPIDVSRWYFRNAADAEAFRKRWMSADD